MNLKIDEYWMKHALDLAHYAEKQEEVPVGAVLVYNNKIIGQGWNQSIRLHDPTAHAEIMALREGGKILENYRLLNTVLYVTLEPCLMCIGAIIHSRIKRLVYGAKDKKNDLFNTFVHSLNYRRVNSKIQIDHGILASECSIILLDFFRMCRSQNKTRT